MRDLPSLVSLSLIYFTFLASIASAGEDRLCAAEYGEYPIGECTRRYYSCAKGRFHAEFRCIKDFVFNKGSGRCDYLGNVEACRNNRDRSASGLSIDLSICVNLGVGTYPIGRCSDQYLVCSQGNIARISSCNYDGGVYDSGAQQCRPQSSVKQCATSPEFRAIPDEVGSAICGKEPWGTPYSLSCSPKYTVCVKDRPFHFTCPDGTYFNRDTSKCDYKENIASCRHSVLDRTEESLASDLQLRTNVDGASASKSIDAQPPLTDASKHGTTKRDLERGIFCIGKADGHYSIGPCLDKFYLCANSKTYVMPCPANLKFDGFKCDYAYEIEGCKSIPPIAPILTSTSIAPVSSPAPAPVPVPRPIVYAQPTPAPIPPISAPSIQAVLTTAASVVPTPRPRNLVQTVTNNFCKEGTNYARGNCQSNYYQCSQGRLVNRDCPVGQVFDDVARECMVGASCGSTAPFESLPLTCVPQTTRAISTCKQQYYRCMMEGIWAIYECQAGFVFDVVAMECVAMEGVTACATNVPMVSPRPLVVTPQPVVQPLEAKRIKLPDYPVISKSYEQVADWFNVPTYKTGVPPQSPPIMTAFSGGMVGSSRDGDYSAASGNPTAYGYINSPYFNG